MIFIKFKISHCFRKRIQNKIRGLYLTGIVTGGIAYCYVLNVSSSCLRPKKGKINNK